MLNEEHFKLLIDELENSLSNLDLLKKDKCLSVALSGGADSVSLFCTAVILQIKYKYKLFAVHVEHGLRGEESKKDAEYVKTLCKKYNVPLYLKNITTINPNEKGLELKARNERFTVFAQAIKQQKADALLISHHAEDQAETLLLHLIRGSGITGLSGIKKVIPFEDALIIRPFLQLSKSDLLYALDSSNISYRVDKSNFETICNRNRLRLEIIPLIKKIEPNFAKSILRTTEQMALDDSYFDEICNDFINNNACIKSPYCYVNIDKLQNIHKSIAIRVLRRMTNIALRQHNLELGFSQTGEYSISYSMSNMLYDLINQDYGSAVALPSRLVARRSHTRIHFEYLDSEPNQDEIKADKLLYSKTISLNNLTIHTEKTDSCISNGTTIQSIPISLLKDSVFRHRRIGDKIQPFGMHGTQKLKKYLIGHKIDRSFRDSIFILANKSDVLWIPGVGASQMLKIDEESIVLKVNGNIPWNKD